MARKLKGILTEDEVCAALDISKRQLHRFRLLGFPSRAVNRENRFYLEKEITEFMGSLPRFSQDELDTD